MGFGQKRDVSFMKTPPSTLAWSGLSVGYRTEHPILSHLRGSLVNGGLHVFIGRNGTGKSTLIRTLAGLQRPLSGEVRFNERKVHEMEARTRAACVAYVDSTPPRASELSVGEVLSLVEPDAHIAREVLGGMGAASWWERRLDTLSDGQSQRVMLVRAALQQTPWILLDEPTAFLDVPARKAFWNMAEEHARKGCGLIVATHDYAELANMEMLASVTLVKNGALTSLDPLQTAEEWTAQMGAEL